MTTETNQGRGETASSATSTNDAAAAPSGRRPRRFFLQWPATTFLLAVYVGLFAAMAFVQGGLLRGGGFLDAYSVRADVLAAFGALEAKAVLRDHQYWRLLTALFLHGSIVHLLFNGAAIWQLGRAIEEWFGGAVLLLLHLVLGGVANALSLFAHASAGPFLQVGASGALFGMITFLAMVAWHGRNQGGVWLMISLVFWTIFGLGFGAYLGADNAAHAGGAAAGIIVGNFEILLRPECLPRGAARAIAGACLAVIALVFGLDGFSHRVVSQRSRELRREIIARQAADQARWAVQADRWLRVAVSAAHSAPGEGPAGIDRRFIAANLEAIAARTTNPSLQRLLLDCAARMHPESEEAFESEENLRALSQIERRRQEIFTPRRRP